MTEQSHAVPENQVPGVFVKFDIEPILLTIAEEWSSIPALFIRLVNVVSGVLVAGGWCYALSEWAKDSRKIKRSNTSTEGILSPVSARGEKSGGFLSPVMERGKTSGGLYEILSPVVGRGEKVGGL